jgi:hypothetical protein
MLLARSVGSIGMALPAFLVPDWRTVSRALQRGGKVAKRANSRRVGRPDRGWVREATRVRCQEADQEQRA